MSSGGWREGQSAVESMSVQRNLGFDPTVRWPLEPHLTTQWWQRTRALGSDIINLWLQCHHLLRGCPFPQIGFTSKMRTSHHVWYLVGSITGGWSLHLSGCDILVFFFSTSFSKQRTQTWGQGPSLPTLAFPAALSRESPCGLEHMDWLYNTSAIQVARQASLSVGFSRQEYWSGLPCPPPGDLPNPAIKPRAPVLQADSLPSGSLLFI